VTWPARPYLCCRTEPCQRSPHSCRPVLTIPLLPMPADTRRGIPRSTLPLLPEPTQPKDTWADLDQPLLPQRSGVLPVERHGAPPYPCCLSVTTPYTGCCRFIAASTCHGTTRLGCTDHPVTASADHPFRVEDLTYQNWPGLGCPTATLLAFAWPALRDHNLPELPQLGIPERARPGPAVTHPCCLSVTIGYTADCRFTTCQSVSWLRMTHLAYP
jgi:hypothetical protein